MRTIIFIYQADKMELLHTIDGDKCSKCAISNSLIEYQNNLYKIKDVSTITEIDGVKIHIYMVNDIRYKWALSINGISKCDSCITFSNREQCYGDMQHVAIEKLKQKTIFDNLHSYNIDNFSMEFNKSFIKIKENNEIYHYKIILV